MRCLGICRVSTAEQARSNHFSLAHQRQVIAEYVRKQGWVVVDWVEYVQSGGSNARELREIRQRIQDRDIQAVVVAELDRLTRDMISTLLFVEDLRQWGVRLVAVKDGLDGVTDPMSEMRMMFLGMFAHHFRHQLSTKVRGGLTERWRAGKAHGRRPYGYQFDSTGHLVPDPHESPIVRQIFTWYHQGVGLRGICQRLAQQGIPSMLGGHWDPRTIKRMLENPVYRGDLPFQRVRMTRTRDGQRVRQPTTPQIRPQTHEPLIDPAIWDAVQDLRTQRRHLGPSAQFSPYPASGLIVCGQCGHKMGHHVRDTYVCRSYLSGQGCSRTTAVKRRAVESAILHALEAERARPFDMAMWLRWVLVVPHGPEYVHDLHEWEHRRQNLMTTAQRARDAYLAGLLSLDEFRTCVQDPAPVPPVPVEAPTHVQAVLDQAIARLRQWLTAPDTIEAQLVRDTILQCVRRIQVNSAQDIAVEVGGPLVDLTWEPSAASPIPSAHPLMTEIVGATTSP